MSSWNGLILDKVEIRQDILSQSGDKAAMTFGTLWALVVIRGDNPVQIGLNDLTRLSHMSRATTVKTLDKLLDNGQILDATQKRKVGAQHYGDMYYTLQTPPWETEHITIDPLDMDWLGLNMGELITARMYEWFELRKKHEVTASNSTLAAWRGIGLRTLKRHKQALMSQEYVYLNGNYNGFIGCLNTNIPTRSIAEPEQKPNIPMLLLEYRHAVGNEYIQFKPKQIERAKELQHMLSSIGWTPRAYVNAVVAGCKWMLKKNGWPYLYVHAFLGPYAEREFFSKWMYGDMKL